MHTPLLCKFDLFSSGWVLFDRIHVIDVNTKVEWEKMEELRGQRWCKPAKLYCKKIPIQQVVCHCDLAIYIKKYLNAKEELWKLKYFHHVHIKICKNSSKRNQNPSRYYNSRTNFKFNTSRNIIFQKSSYKNRPIT